MTCNILNVASICVRDDQSSGSGRIWNPECNKVGCEHIKTQTMLPKNSFFSSFNTDGIASKDSFWMLITLPKIVLLCFTIFSLSACLTFLDPTMSLFVSEKVSHFNV